MNNRFIIIIGSYNNEPWVESNIGSVLSQDYKNYKAVYCDDHSTDNTYEKVQQMVKDDKRFVTIKNAGRVFKTWFFHNFTHYQSINDNDILVFLDGDDMFYCENVLSYLNEVYNQTECWMTYGGMLVWNGGSFISEPFPQNTIIPSEVIVNKAYRKDTWRTSHLKTMRGFLWNAFDKKDLYPDGRYMVGPDDLAIMFSMLELCPPEKVYRVTEPIYLYNHTEQNQKSRAFFEHKNAGIDYEFLVRSRTPYDTISFVMPTLIGGLGNQMFEIATAASLAKDNNAVAIINPDEHILPNQGRNVNNYLNNVFSRIMCDNTLSPKNTFEQSGQIYNSIPYKPNLKLNGHFQSWKYFDHHKKYINDLFSPTEEIQKELNEKFSWLKDCTAIQVRRGDALTERAKGYHPVPTLEYIYQATKLANPSHIVIFSDDVEWCRQNLKFDALCDFSACQEKEKDYMEIYMMAMCQNIIISNSTFGWWGAYLNARPDKKVYAPLEWFGPKITQHGFDIKELIPSDWILL